MKFAIIYCRPANIRFHSNLPGYFGQYLTAKRSLYWPLRTHTAGSSSYRRIPLISVDNTAVAFITDIETLLDTLALIFALLHS
jgi:hypothetical protein